MLDKILENNIDMLERPPAAFLIPHEQSGIDLLHLSDCFWQTNKLLLPERYGLVLQDKITEAGQTTTASLIFDARQRENKRFLWQLTHTNNGSRSIHQLVVQEAEDSPRTPKYLLNGYVFEADTQGRVNKVTQVPEGQVDTTIYYSFWHQGLVGILKSERFKDHVKKIKDKKETAQAELLRFVSERTITKTVPRLEIKDGVTVKTGERTIRDFKVTRDRYEQIHNELKLQVERIGFVALTPYKHIVANPQLDR